MADERTHFFFKGAVEDLNITLNNTLDRIEKVDLVLRDLSASCEIEMTEEQAWRLLDAFEDPEWPNVVGE